MDHIGDPFAPNCMSDGEMFDGGIVLAGAVSALLITLGIFFNIEPYRIKCSKSDENENTADYTLGNRLLASIRRHSMYRRNHR